MNTIVTRLRANELPEHVRGGIDLTHEVEVTVRDLGVPRLNGAEAFALLEAYVERHGRTDETMDDAVQRVSDLRDEWER